MGAPQAATRTAPVIAIFGPTGSGKTEIAVETARMLRTEVVNCDPAQCYRGLPILTNQPTAAHDAVAPHRMVASWPLSEEASVARFSQQAHEQIDSVVEAHGAVVLAGGSGLYMLAAIAQLQFAAAGAEARPAHAGLQRELAERYDSEGGGALHEQLAQLDAAAAARVHPNDRKRLLRALEAALGGGSVAPGGASHWDAPHRHQTALFGLRVDRSTLHARIDARTRAMFERGVLAEVAGVVGPAAEHSERELSRTARRIHGLQDCIGVLRGDHDRDVAITRLATRTRQYAKRQDTWARRWPGLRPVAVDAASPDPRDVATLLVADGARPPRRPGATVASTT